MTKAEYTKKYLKPALTHMDFRITDVKYVKNDCVHVTQDRTVHYPEEIVVTFEGGDVKIANVTHDSFKAMYVDVANQVLKDM